MNLKDPETWFMLALLLVGLGLGLPIVIFTSYLAWGAVLALF